MRLDEIVLQEPQKKKKKIKKGRKRKKKSTFPRVHIKCKKHIQILESCPPKGE